ncbi:MAG: bifunctional glycosyltransferase family 2/GtrA family protein [Kiritimatiellae bacterium]|nr:bifunctional glycosyltransferase family 2/GtrA family protein [Kiritimatiellia bacterium]
MEKRQADGELSEGCRNAVVLIPAYNPDEKLLALLAELKERFFRVVLVDDGSTDGREIFDRASGMVEKLLTHPVNRGKGAALKTGLSCIGERDVVTADADGQHTVDDILKVADGLRMRRSGLVLGVRSFSRGVPLRSRFGNFWTRWFFFLMTGLNVRDTQTGLRGIPGPLVKRMLSIAGERYEYEMAMLADAKGHEEKPLQIPISTVYINSNRASHFKPLSDTVRIYRSLFKFCVSSILCFLMDNAVYAMLVWVLAGKGMTRGRYTLIALLCARFVSSNFNYLCNRFVVFKSGIPRRKRVHHSYFSYWGLVAVIGAASYILTGALGALLGVDGVLITAVKIFVDVMLFFLGYFLQKRFVFR